MNSKLPLVVSLACLTLGTASLSHAANPLPPIDKPGLAVDLVDFVQFPAATGSDSRDGINFLLESPDDSGRLFVLDSRGGIRMIDGDMDGDGFVGVDDLNLVLDNWNQQVPARNPLRGDPTGDGFVGIDDLNVVLGNWNAGTPPSDGSTQIPEPAVVWLIGPGLLGLLRRRRGDNTPS